MVMLVVKVTPATVLHLVDLHLTLVVVVLVVKDITTLMVVQAVQQHCY